MGPWYIHSSSSSQARETVDRWRSLLGPPAERPRLAVCWAGGGKGSGRPRRSIVALSPLRAIPKGLQLSDGKSDTWARSDELVIVHKVIEY